MAVAGDHAWDTEPAPLLAGREVAVVMGCDTAPVSGLPSGIASNPESRRASAEIIKLAARHDDG